MLLHALGIGFCAGLRSMVTPALVAWAAHLDWLPLRGTPLGFMATPLMVGIFSLLAILELIADLRPSTPARTGAVGLIARIITGGLCGACIYEASGSSLAMGAVLGIAGALIGAYGGYYTRRGLVRGLNVKDALIAIPEDMIAIGLAYLIVR
jgi:uncharacterized membrane protein